MVNRRRFYAQTDEFDNTVLPLNLVTRLARGIGCAQCGRKTNEHYLGYPCCAATQCRTQLWWVVRSIRVSQILSQRAA